MDVIDLRSDTVTHPTPAMREVMAKAVVGDDVYGDDETVNRLERESAEMFGKEAGLFVSSGTQGNLVSLMTHCERGTEIILGHNSHIFKNEQGGISALGGIMPHTIPVQSDGTLCLEDIEDAIRGDNEHYPRTRVVTVENTQNSAGGAALSPSYIQSVSEMAHRHDLKMHIDGARIFNAITAYQTTPQEMIGEADSMTFCLSKGLCAPVGSVIVGDSAFIKEARRARKVLGGGMRQAGILAAAGLIAIHEMSQRLQEDHDNAALLAEGLSAVPGMTVVMQKTNFVRIQLNEDAKLDTASFVAAMKTHNILISAYSGQPGAFRLVTHYWITRERVEQIIEAVKTVLA